VSEVSTVPAMAKLIYSAIAGTVLTSDTRPRYGHR